MILTTTLFALTIHTELNLQTNIKNVHSAGSQTQCKKDYSINRECILTELPLISISRSFPHNWMHLCLENHGKNLISFWKGTYKGMDEGQCKWDNWVELHQNPSYECINRGLAKWALATLELICAMRVVIVEDELE